MTEKSTLQSIRERGKVPFRNLELVPCQSLVAGQSLKFFVTVQVKQFGRHRRCFMHQCFLPHQRTFLRDDPLLNQEAPRLTCLTCNGTFKNNTHKPPETPTLPAGEAPPPHPYYF